MAIKDNLATHGDLTILYQAGFGANTVPALLKQGILEHIANMYDKQEEQSGLLSNAVRNFYLPYRFLRI